MKTLHWRVVNRRAFTAHGNGDSISFTDGFVFKGRVLKPLVTVND